MPVWLLPSIMALLSIGATNRKENDVSKKYDLAAKKDRLSWVTGQQGQVPDAAPDKFMGAAQAALTGFAATQALNSATNADKLVEAQTGYLNRASGGPSEVLPQGMMNDMTVPVTPNIKTPAPFLEDPRYNLGMSDPRKMQNIARYQQSINSPWGYV